MLQYRLPCHHENKVNRLPNFRRKAFPTPIGWNGSPHPPHHHNRLSIARSMYLLWELRVQPRSGVADEFLQKTIIRDPLERKRWSALGFTCWRRASSFARQQSTENNKSMWRAGGF